MLRGLRMSLLLNAKNAKNAKARRREGYRLFISHAPHLPPTEEIRQILNY